MATFFMDGGDRINYYANGFDSMINFWFEVCRTS